MSDNEQTMRAGESAAPHSKPAAAPTKIALRDVSKTFKRTDGGKTTTVEVFDGLDFAVPEKAFVTIIGPSGCGKTTLLRLIASLEQPDSGEVLIDGERVREPSEDRAVVFQSFGLFPWKTVLDNVRFPLKVRDIDKEEATEIALRFIHKVGLEGFESSYPRMLSGGMQQRVGLARALACDPDILLMDEPFGAVDAQTRELLQEELLRLVAHADKTVIFITHDLDEAVLLADQIVVLSRRPAKVREVIDVPLPHPRWEHDPRGEKTFIDIRSHIWTMLRSDLLEDQGMQGSADGD